MKTLSYIFFCLLSCITFCRADVATERAPFVKLQIYLDQKNFGPGYIDGRLGHFTKLAIATFNRSKGRALDDEASILAEAEASIKQAYQEVTVPDIAKKYVDPTLPTKRPLQAKRKSMPYRSVGEFMAERYHCSVEFLQLINGAKKLNQAKEGATLLVPNIPAFQIENMASGRSYAADPMYANRRVSVDTKMNQIRIYATPRLVNPKVPQAPATPDSQIVPQEGAVNEPIEEEKIAPKAIIVQTDDLRSDGIAEVDSELIAAFPITPGQEKFIRYGLWEVRSCIELPVWHFDESLLKTGKRSKNGYDIPGGPNNPVGVIWTGLSRAGIGIHGTSDPETIGRSRSAGCIRLANWDAARIPTLIRPGVKVWLK